MLKECEEKIAVLGERVAERDKELRLQGVELIDELQKRISLYEEEMGQLKGQAAAVKGSLDTALKDKARAETELARLKERKEQVEAEALPQLEAEVARLKTELEHMDKLKELYADVELKRVRKEEELGKTAERCRELEDRLAAQAKDHETEKASLMESQNKALESVGFLPSSFTTATSQLNDRLCISEQAALLADTSKDEALAAKEATISHLQDELANANRAREELIAQLHAKQENISSLLLAQEESGRVWQATVSDLKDRNEELQLLLDKSQTESKKEVADAWEREQKMRKDADIMKTRMEEQGDRLNAMIGKVRELKDACKKIEQDGNEKLEAFREAHEYEQEKWRRELQIVQEENEEKLQRAQQVLEIAEKNHVETLEKARRDHREELDKLKVHLHAQANDQLRKLKQASDEEKVELQQQHKAQLEAAKADHEAKCEQVAKELSDRAAAAELALQQEISRLEDECRRLQQELETELENANTSRETIQSLRDELAALTQNIAQLHAEAKALQHSHKDELEQLNDSYTKKIDDLEEDHRQKISNLEAAHEQNIEAKKYELAFLKEEHLKTLQETREEMDMLQQKLQGRPPRDEDLSLIALLNDRLLYCENQMDYLQQKLSAYRLELLNRETNYNKIFNANPVVGVLDPLASKCSTASERNGSGQQLPAEATMIFSTRTHSLTGQEGESKFGSLADYVKRKFTPKKMGKLEKRGEAQSSTQPNLTGDKS
ncbi:viral a-type inclusion protein [Cystoisospora suis]|uniref:Viral a-type inclusion protein n=1 Tax=Cystoisospora suis TaxID=483139 RepID=A0A2C6LI38_9APIC|nr:viral a-type inclusion protein [Cystoisospora suis]